MHIAVIFISIGRIPLRELVYRVHELPPSMLPLIFDFGRLDDATEKKYIHKIVSNQVRILLHMFEFSECHIFKDNVDSRERI